MAPKSEKTDLRLDKRVLDRHLARGSITRQDVEKHLGSLKDLGDQAENIADLVYSPDAAPKTGNGVSH